MAAVALVGSRSLSVVVRVLALAHLRRAMVGTRANDYPPEQAQRACVANTFAPRSFPPLATAVTVESLTRTAACATVPQTEHAPLTDNPQHTQASGTDTTYIDRVRGLPARNTIVAWRERRG